MTKILLSEFVTMDGVMEAPGGEAGHPHTGWAAGYMGEEEIGYAYQLTLEASALLIGRVTYESFAGAWPTYEGEFADRMNAMPKFVVSNTLKNPDWPNTTVLDGDAIARIRELKAGDGAPLLALGSKTLVHSLLKHDLIDEMRISVFPVTVGSGFRLFPESPDLARFKLTGTRAFGSGVALLTYQRA
jgi:dihydrofolate reductase